MGAKESILYSLLAVVALALIPVLGTALGLAALFGVVIPYLAVAVFLGGVIYRVVGWARSPVPYVITSTCGQQWSLPWIKANRLENPPDGTWTLARMALEVLCFRSLFRNSKVDLRAEQPKLAYGSEKFLWLGAIAFHYAFLTIVIRHMRFFTEPIPWAVQMLENADGFFQMTVPTLYQTDIVILLAVGFLFLRRVVMPNIRYISVGAEDYFPLLLIFGIALSGILMRFVFRVDVTAVKELAMGLATFHPVVPAGIGAWFYVHLFLVCVLLVFFPFGKLAHMAGVFMSPTRNLPNNSRYVRHVNPWNYPVKIHTYDEYEEEFREKMVEAGLPVEKPVEEKE